MSQLLDATWKRLLLAVVVSLGIILGFRVFAESTYVQSQKLQLESARGDHCKKWQVTSQNGLESVQCLRWSKS